jgi:hypothetical protein
VSEGLADHELRVREGGGKEARPTTRTRRAGVTNAARIRTELVAQLGRLEVRAEFLQAQRAEATRRLGEIARERERVRRHLAALDRTQEVTA